jgi:hypothetical protein
VGDKVDDKGGDEALGARLRPTPARQVGAAGKVGDPPTQAMEGRPARLHAALRRGASSGGSQGILPVRP